MKDHKFFGTTTIGERGQVVVPAEARTALSLDKGEKLLVFGMDDDMLILAKFSSFQRITEELKKRQKMLNKILKEQ